MCDLSRFEREFFSPEVDTCGFEYKTSATNENVRGNAMHATSRSLFALESFALIAAVMFSAAIVSCGSNSNISDTPLDLTLLNEGQTPVNLQQADEGVFSGKVVVKFKEGTDVSLDELTQEGPFKSSYKSVSAKINSIILDPDLKISDVSRVLQISEEEFVQVREYWAAQDVELHNWNLAYYLEVPSEEEGSKVVAAFKDDPNVEYVEVLPRIYLASVMTKNFNDGEGGYLDDLGVNSIQLEGRGQNTTVIDQEFDWNLDHEALLIPLTDDYLIHPTIAVWTDTENIYPGKGDPSNINHGTAVLGVLAGEGKISGIVPSTHLEVANLDGGAGIMGAADIRYAEGTRPAGAILTIEGQFKGALTGTSSGCSVSAGTDGYAVTGCVPVESLNSIYQSIKGAVATGFIIVEAAGNGSVNLDDPSNASPYNPSPDPQSGNSYSGFATPADIESKDSGSILVGASTGTTAREKAQWSNCGDRVNVFAWGGNVVTSGYGNYCVEQNCTYGNLDYNPNGLNSPSATDPSIYTNAFGGTSAATAQIAGIAALVQSRMREIVEDAGYVDKTVYLDSKQIREILVNSGAGRTATGDCNIGVQPNAADAIENWNGYLNTDPEFFATRGSDILKIAPLNSTVVSGIRYDMDDDGKADLISFSRDHKWYVDLSNTQSVDESPNFGAWDISGLVIQAADSEDNFQSNSMLFPVVGDYNSDGRADLALYDSINRKWYIKYTNKALISGSITEFSWDRIVPYSGNVPLYSRPIPADYDNDKFLDLALQTPDGHLLIDYGGFNGVRLDQNGHIEYDDKFGDIDRDDYYLSNENLSKEAPGWAWLAFPLGITAQKASLIIKSPDNISESPANRLYRGVSGSSTFVIESDYFDGTLNFDVGGNDEFVFPGMMFPSSNSFVIGIKKSNGEIKLGYMDNQNTGFIEYFSETNSDNYTGYGDLLCRPIPADYDGDSKVDRAVQCGNKWIIYSSKQDAKLPEIVLDEALDPLPAFVYPGGMSYQDIKSFVEYYGSELPDSDTPSCSDGSKLCTVIPPVGPYFAECLRYWGANPSDCWDK